MHKFSVVQCRTIDQKDANIDIDNIIEAYVILVSENVNNKSFRSQNVLIQHINIKLKVLNPTKFEPFKLKAILSVSGLLPKLLIVVFNPKIKDNNICLYSFLFFDIINDTIIYTHI